ncbi:methyltransferase domain-containing protein [Vibrio sp. SM6]|uniref:Methyltransferase domain-containing protein n=1 Tax=Vibrio agarilyticus TaxID=2726741 RepID=A0A7X8TP75_9VIBR|nr:MerR family transcriptional regulator [Vibrio agarilyticus]NLS12180.1 methyltransferase domain-containing protein [Vibrio agarilyticus]
MYRISQLAAKVGLSRTALLYYEKLGLIQGARSPNGYRYYDEQDVEWVRFVQQLQMGGLSLEQCKLCLDAKLDREMLREKLTALEREIEQKQQAQALLQALLGQKPLRDWHQRLDKIAPSVHQAWLQLQGLDSEQALRLKWISKDLNHHEHYMNDFDQIFASLERWGPGSEAVTLAALAQVPFAPKQILEVGCGTGIATMALAKATQARIIAVDNQESALAALTKRFEPTAFGDRVEGVKANMMALPFVSPSFDLIWAEGCAYIMGVEAALKQWRPLLHDEGVLVLSDLVWCENNPSADIAQFWQQNYPDMVSVQTRLEQAQRAGYHVLATVPYDEKAWLNYYQPLQRRLNSLDSAGKRSAAFADLEREIAISAQRGNQFNYQMFILQKNQMGE